MSFGNDNSTRCRLPLPQYRPYSLVQTRPIASQCNCWARLFHFSAVHLYFRHILCGLNYSRKDVCFSFSQTDHYPSLDLASPQQGNQTITDYMQDVKHNIDSLALMNVSIDFDELSIRVLKGLGLAYSHISHALQAWNTPVTFEELFEHLLSYEAQMKILVHSAPPASTPASALVTSTGPSLHRQLNNRGRRTQNRSQ